MFDVAIIGAGVNGSALSYFLSEAGLHVALIDKDGIAAGGSGAAGAFISPKISKSGELKDLIDKAFEFTTNFYKYNFPTLFNETPLFHSAKNEFENSKVLAFKNGSKFSSEIPKGYNSDFESVYVEGGGIVNAKKLCSALSKKAKFFRHEVKNLIENDNYWLVDELLKAKKVV